jgi:hypothetical protein
MPEMSADSDKSYTNRQKFVPNRKSPEGKHLSIQETKQTRIKPKDGISLTNSGKNVAV